MRISTLTTTKSKAASGIDRPGRNRSGFGDDGFGGDSGESRSAGYGPAVPARAYRTGMWMALAAIVMLFAAFSSALVVRKGLSSDWVAISLPGILWLNTFVLVTSSFTLELSRKSLKAGAGGRFARWWYATVGLGLVFIAGQLVAWRQLATRGVYLSTNPSSSFFYLLTAAHGVHLLGGICALFYVVFRARGHLLAPENRTAVEVTAIYWHFMDGLWIYIILLLLVR